MSEQLTSQSFEDITGPIAAEMEFTANQIIAEQQTTAPTLGGVLGLELSGNPDIVPLADDTLSCTNPTCKTGTCFQG